MDSIYKRVLGADFERLHLEIQRRVGFSSKDKVAAIGTGIMEEIWHGPVYTLPFLYIGTRRAFMLPDRGTYVPLPMLNYAYLDSHGREPVTCIRRLQTIR